VAKRFFSSPKSLQTTGAHPASYLLVAVKWLGFEANHSPASISKVNNDWSYTFYCTLCAFMEWTGTTLLFVLPFAQPTSV
jgi:hypothetical protein